MLIKGECKQLVIVVNFVLTLFDDISIHFLDNSIIINLLVRDKSLPLLCCKSIHSDINTFGLVKQNFRYSKNTVHFLYQLLLYLQYFRYICRNYPSLTKRFHFS